MTTAGKNLVSFQENNGERNIKPGAEPPAPPAPSAKSATFRRPDSNASMTSSDEPKNIFEAAERGVTNYIVKQVERSLEYDVNQRDKIQRTALHWAAELNHVKTAEVLLDYGVDPLALECTGRSAIHLAAREGHVEMLETLMESMDEKQKEACANQPDIYGITPVFLSLQKGEDSRPAFQYLMKMGGKYNAQLPRAESASQATVRGPGEGKIPRMSMPGAIDLS